MKSKTPAPPKVADPVPVPQPDDPNLVETRRNAAAASQTREGFQASLLTPGGAKGVSGGDAGTKRRTLGMGSIASGGTY